ncbi:MAG TPA: hypothetical protein VK536_07260 [Candidatus Limnocylindrales bacterium]|nr:hypothetical protein [Candidatus Limnocylindrales bacterium]
MPNQQIANEAAVSNVQFQEILDAFENEDYEKMAVSAHAYLEQNKDETCKLTVTLAKYFKLFGEGYAKWQRSYKYNLVRELFYCAQLLLNACPETDKNDLMLREAFKHLTNMLIAYTHCENSCICNDAEALEFYSGICEKEEEEGIRIVETLRNDRLTQILLSYLKRNYHYHSGLRIFSETYRRFLTNNIGEKEYDDALTQINQRLDQLNEEDCPELASELRAHRENLKRLKDTRSAEEDIRLPGTEIRWMMTAYVGDNIARTLNDEVFNSNGTGKVKKQFESYLEKEWSTDLEFAPLEIGDIFDTSLGRENTMGLTFSLPTAYVVASGDIYPLEVEMKISVLGVCSVVMKTNIDDVIRGSNQEVPGRSLMHVRTLQSMVTPHSGNFLTLWIKENGEPFDESTVGKITKRRRFIHPYEFLTESENIINESSDQALPASNLKEIQNKMQQTHKKLTELAEDHVERPVLKKNEKIQITRDQIKKFRGELKELLEKSIQTLSQSKDTSRIAEKVRNVCDEISIQENSYYNLNKLMERILSRDIKGAMTIENAEKKPEIIWVFEPHRNWYTYLYCREIYIGQKLAYADDLLDSDLKDLLIELREARPSLETDCIFGADCSISDRKNLGPIRSHKHDALYIMENQALMYFPDDPQYITDQYASTIELVWWIRSLVLAFNKMVDKQIQETTQRFIRGDKVSTDHEYKDMEDSVDYLQKRINGLERFRARALNTIKIFESLSVSRYQDHAELMRETLKSSNIQQLKANLEDGLENILRLQRHLNERTTIQIAQIEREREKDEARRMTIFTIVLMLASISFPFEVLYQRLNSIWVVILYVAIIPVAFLLIFAFRRNKPKNSSKPTQNNNARPST